MAAKNRVNHGQQYRRRGSQAPYVYGNVAVEVEPGYHEQSPEKPKKKVMQKELANLKEENNAKFNAVMDSVNLDEIRDRAQNQLGMVYASPEQIVEYDNPATDYVKQFEEIPDDGVLAQSGKRNR